ncbi:43089_t:CDS:2 [Gigaspora margarita]|uniref:43089_t:CDS:1 n=1 Tax=Gigaspora margarita TaxID=4874 RepID=A0ABN7V3K0_GIGMA|nr:43089_t:CDS:2 [Gigaspora margarita]
MLNGLEIPLDLYELFIDQINLIDNNDIKYFDPIKSSIICVYDLDSQLKKIIQRGFGLSSLVTNKAHNESNNPFQRAKIGHKADMKGTLKNTSCKLELLYEEVTRGFGPFGLSIASKKKIYLDKIKLSIIMYNSINKALKQ